MDRHLFQMDIVEHRSTIIERLSLSGYSDEEITTRFYALTYDLNVAYMAGEISSVQPRLDVLLFGLTNTQNAA